MNVGRRSHVATAAISSLVNGTQITSPVFFWVTLMPGRPSDFLESDHRILTRSEPRCPVFAASVMTRARCGRARFCEPDLFLCPWLMPPVEPVASVPVVMG